MPPWMTFQVILKLPRVVQKLNFEPENFKCGNFNKEIRYETISEQIMTELESYFINFEIAGDEMAENEPAIDETTGDKRAKDKMADDDPTEDQTSKDAEALYNSIIIPFIFLFFSFCQFLKE